MNITIFVGARPNFIKAAPLIKAINKARLAGHKINGALVYAGSKDDSSIEKTLYADLNISEPDVFLEIVTDNLNELTGQVISKFDEFLVQNPQDLVIVVDDLASTMAAAIVTKKRGVKLAHIVAGTRSFDIKMPKEINRLVIDGLSDLLFTAGVGNSSIATKEGIEHSKIYLVGNILLDTLRQTYSKQIKSDILSQENISDSSYLVFTLNRNVIINDNDKVRKIIKAITNASPQTHVIAPLRDKACRIVKEILKQDFPQNNWLVVEPLTYPEFAYLTSHAKGIITDSGNVAEEATFNGIPCITLNSYTEHKETVTIGTNVLVGEDISLLSKYTNDMCNSHWKQANIPDRWDGRTAERIIQIVLEQNYPT